jgi:vacuole morphology and inheritance protein 14
VKLRDLIDGIKKETESNESLINDFMSRVNIDKEEEENKEGIMIENNYEIVSNASIPNHEYKAVCYTWFIVNDRNRNIDWKKPLIQKSQITSRVKISQSPFAKGGMRYAFYMQDTYLNQKLVGKLPISIRESDYTADNLSKDIESLIICQYLANDFNDRIINSVPDTRLLLNFVHSFVYEIQTNSKFNLYAVENYIDGDYEKYNNNAGWINSNLNESALIANAFTHFTWQITKGYLMVVDLQGVSGVLTDPQIHCLDSKKFGSGNLGYYGMMKFFLTHYCNEYCKELKLVHPRKKLVIDDSFDFFVDNYSSPRNPDDKVYRLCDLCKGPFKLKAQIAYEKKVASQEAYCDSCDQQRKYSMKEGVCVNNSCGERFRSSEYWFKMKRTDFPDLCSKCRAERRDRMRNELNNS